MGLEYALVHIKYTIPPGILLTVFYRPLFTRLDAYKLVFLLTIALVSTIPWDSYLIRNRIWSYPTHVIIGPKLWSIPLEEVFFFIIQTYDTSLLYLILSRPTYQPYYLRVERPHGDPQGPANAQWRYYKWAGQGILGGIVVLGWYMVKDAALATYTGLILIWAMPFLLLLWSLAYQFILGLPLSNTAAPILLPTLYLWIVDTLALRRGTWVINHGTKLGVHLWEGLEIEEALFFLVTNMLIVFGQLAFDNALAVINAFPDLFPDTSSLPSPWVLVRSLLISAAKYDRSRLRGLREAVGRLKKKSRSFYLASSTFQGQIRTDLLLLYSFCRVADDLVDNASSPAEARLWISKLHEFLNVAYAQDNADETDTDYLIDKFPDDTKLALVQLPVGKLSREPLDNLLRGFETDLAFVDENSPTATSPIQKESDLALYAHRVAGTVAQMCLELIFYDYESKMKLEDQKRVIDAGNRMGVALQYVNIARDIAVDAKMGRVYIPVPWIEEEGLLVSSILKNPQGARVERLRAKLLSRAFALHKGAKDAIEELPVEARGPLRVAVESYMEIGRVLSQEGYVVKAGRATVPKLRRLKVAWRTLSKR